MTGRKILTGQAIAALAAMLLPAPAQAAGGDVHFGVNITRINFCTILLQEPGAIAPDASNQVLSSKEAGGQPGKARVTALTNYQVTVDDVPFFLSEPGGMSVGSSFVASFSGQSVYRGINFAERDGANAVTLPRRYSITDLTIDLEVSRASAFAAGDYTALTIVRCE
ncbi:MAG: hypothetical protein CMJ42_19845 [Phyllobacteriaceae bacterium]|nr:hypothetical protein [Phyllobacteriaceae bacterium]MBA90336.1 hypothetical protein [Phyllobacteriaceae bacterium]|tara:strand:+ start:50 stop:550 length:501 start_codon:yes stop_codon:yes gene_type:complete